jgi:hypothetical protein
VRRPPALRTTVVVVAGAVYAWVAAGQRPFTLAQEVMVAIPAAVVLLVAVVRPSSRRSGAAAHGSSVPWLALAGVALAWELTAYFSSPRHDHPTMSTIADELMSVHAGRAAVFLLWLGLGWSLVAPPHPDRL